MPKRTDTDWQILDARIAWKVMELEQACIDGDLCWVTPAFNYRYLVYDSATLRIEPEYKVWQPHKNVAQAMLALRTLLAKVRHATASLLMEPSSRYHVVIHNWVASSEVRAMWIGGPRTDNERHAICLAIEQFLDRCESWQKEHGC